VKSYYLQVARQMLTMAIATGFAAVDKGLGGTFFGSST
jgi:hypothetical protein